MKPELDDELISAFLDDELAPQEADAVKGLIESDSAWANRLEEFKEDSRALRKLDAPELTDSKRELAYTLAVSDLEGGRERRRVPRFKRRWMLSAALILPAVLTLLFFQNPNSTSRLYLKTDGLELQAGRSVLEESFGPQKTWVSPPLWANLKRGDFAELSFQVDSKEVGGVKVIGSVEYDFDGDGTIDRTESYEAAEPDSRLGWERFTPELTEFDGDFDKLVGGRISVTLRLENDSQNVTQVSGTPGELILPYQALKTSKGAL